MVNSTQPNSNTITQDNKMNEIVKITIFVLMFLLFGIFVYFMVIILNVFFSTPRVRETSRYILFIHMLLNDVVYLLISFFIYLMAIYFIYMPLPICYIIISFCTCAFSITPYNLAVMSWEPYAAICHPLRHEELWTARRCVLATANMWTVGMIPQLANLLTFCFSVDKQVFNLNFNCHWRPLTVNTFQDTLKILTNVFSFSPVGMVISFKYIKVMLVARRMDSGKFAWKAGKTVLLHAFQLLLSMLSFYSSTTEIYFSSNFLFLPITNFFLFMCLPRFVSPLIYGIRDKVFSKPIRKFYSIVRIHSEHQ
ncbi:odorant receptor 131-2-like [Rhinoderma darwinii]|uniref:odorant receptor 131-2-like n=1 Tax=Rhinoderma darwinii TaxID=43563 RepID=UPI003F66465D